jgi:tRNA-uridine 2-sulfurtransferase
MRILIALSGGIDSSVVAHLLAEQGHDLVGVRFTLWSDPLAPSIAQILPTKCCNAQTAMRAKSVAKTLDIPYHIVDLEKAFKSEVVDPFLDGYRNGQTPNPCIRCNRTIKFGKLLDLAKEFGIWLRSHGDWTLCTHGGGNDA